LFTEQKAGSPNEGASFIELFPYSWHFLRKSTIGSKIWQNDVYSMKLEVYRHYNGSTYEMTNTQCCSEFGNNNVSRK
jgi:hypothetical protein